MLLKSMLIEYYFSVGGGTHNSRAGLGFKSKRAVVRYGKKE